MKIKISALELEKDLERVSSVKKSLKDKTKLFVDANQAYDLRTANTSLINCMIWEFSFRRTNYGA